MNGWNDWGISSGLYNYKPIRNRKRKEDLGRIKVKLTDTAVKFTQLLGPDLKSIFGFIVASPESDHERYWGNELITITAFREGDEYFLTVIGGGSSKDTRASFTLSFDKPRTWKEAVDLKPYCASGNADAVISLAGTFLREWLNCHKLKYNQAQDCWI